MSLLPLLQRHAALAAALTMLLPQLAFAQQSAPQVAPVTVTAAPTSIESELRQRAEAQFALGDYAAALTTYGVLETALTGTARSSSRDALWRALNALPVGTDFSAVTEPIARGWVELLQLAKSGAPLSAYENWRQRHPDHPGESQIAAGLVTATVPARRTGRQIALLLPMSGPLAVVSGAIKSGAIAAQTRLGADAPVVTLYDTSQGLDTAFAAAFNQGADAVIGPLRKEDVSAVAALSPQLPTVTLNYLEGNRAPPAGLTPFGLAPEDEARAAADHATGRSLLRAVILSQEGDWGSRAAAAFRAQFEQRGGTVLAAESFKVNTVDFTRQLKRLLGITYSELRGEQLLAAGVKADLQPVPRGDIDVVFLAARSPQAKLIWPQMRYLRAGRIATYATAAAADAGNSDLGRLTVCDAPWRIETGGQIAALRGELAAVNARTADTQRLFALGYDAYELARRVSVGALNPGETLNGLAGTLVLDTDGAVHRRLDCVPLYSARDEGAVDDAVQ